MSETGRIAILTGEKHIEIKTLPLPEINDDEMLVKVEAVGICGTDVHEYKGDPFRYIPIHLGHEGTGEVVKIGKNVTQDYCRKTLKIGDKIVTGLKPCGDCNICQNQPENIHLCPNGSIYGLMPGKEAFFNGWFGDYIKINRDSVVFNVSDMNQDLRMLIEPAAVVVHAVEKAKEIYNFKHNSNVVIQGCGPIGLLLLCLVRTMGVRNIIAIDGDQGRLDLAKKFGAKHLINIQSSNDPIGNVKTLTNGNGADFAFQCTGSPKAASTVWKYVRSAGGICELGFFVNNGEATYNPHLDVCNKEMKLVGSWTYQSKDWVQAIDFLKESEKQGWPVEQLITHRFSLEEINEAMETNIRMDGIKLAIVLK